MKKVLVVEDDPNISELIQIHRDPRLPNPRFATMEEWGFLKKPIPINVPTW